MKKKTSVLVIAINAEIKKINFLISLKRDLAEFICVDFGKSEFLSIHIFNWNKALYLAQSSIFQHLGCIRAIRLVSCIFQHCIFIKAGSYVLINCWNIELYISLSLRQSKSRLKIWHLLLLDFSCELAFKSYCYLTEAGDKEESNKIIQGWYPHIFEWCRRTLGTRIML